MLTWLYRRLFPDRQDRAALMPLWQRIVEIAREPDWYARGGLEDSVAGRFDAITLALALVLLRMERDPALIAPSARLTELFIADMEGQLREGGMGDPTVGKQVSKLMGSLAGRISALRQGLAATDPQMLIEAVRRNANLTQAANAGLIAADLRGLARTLAALPADELLAGRIPR